MTSREKEIYKVTLIGTVVNALLIVLKLVAGIIGRSSAMVADAVHSLSDFVTDAIVLIFVRIAGLPSDKGHDYGHGKYETLATLIIGCILAMAGIGLLISGIEQVVRSFNGEHLPRPRMVALIVAVLSIASKEWLYRYTVKVGRATESQAVIANAWHHRSDAISSAGTLVGIAGAMFLGEQWRILDPLAAVMVSMFIIKSGYDIIRPSVGELLEASLPDSQEREIRTLVMSIDGIKNVHNLRTRRIGCTIAADMHVKMDGGMSLSEAHALASRAERAIKSQFGENSIVTIHMEPISEPQPRI
ncbi:MULTISPECIES: cation diffusion facilitator family transporter [Bacteroidales]|jgi:cation diffusion facilitator family transporter|uniref:cation diffusion facilitator family transporter n=1 Tax=Bacteroidales TaxID=171549 RepID=UPI000B1E2167|nr:MULTISPECIES: cation diffusion facilitator family transporter [Bacteroidales]ROT18189.1 cation transporter [Muribaculaceae bacterium Isolate-110 (HZI)]